MSNLFSDDKVQEDLLLKENEIDLKDLDAFLCGPLNQIGEDIKMEEPEIFNKMVEENPNVVLGTEPTTELEDEDDDDYDEDEDDDEDDDEDADDEIK